MSTPLFNSLGSNYSDEFVQLAQNQLSNPLEDKYSAVAELTQQLEKRFSGECLFVYKGRDAIELVLRPIVEAELQHSDKSLKLGVLTQGLACHAIEEGITRAGMLPVYIDLESGTLGPSLQTLQSALKRAEQQGVAVKAVFLQHTLGYVNPLAEIEKFCTKHQLILIEDLAQSFGAEEKAGKEVGKRADAVILSFGRDKVLDGVSGGGVIYKNSFWKKVKLHSKNWLVAHSSLPYPPLQHVRKELAYPWLTRLVRHTHRSGVGKVIFQLAKIFGLFTSPISSPTLTPTKLPPAYASLILWQLNHLKEQLAHRRKVAAVYQKGLAQLSSVQIVSTEKRIKLDLHLRVPILLETAAQMRQVITALQENQIFVSDRWYRTVVDSGSLNYSTLYQTKTCPVAEDVAKRLLNLPTHQYVTIDDARRIVQVIKSTIKKK